MTAAAVSGAAESVTSVEKSALLGAGALLAEVDERAALEALDLLARALVEALLALTDDEGVGVGGRVDRVGVGVRFGVGSMTTNVPRVALRPVEMNARTVPSPRNAAKLAEQVPVPDGSVRAHRTRPPPVIETDVASHDPRRTPTDAVTEIVSPTCAGFGPPMPPVSEHRGGGSASARAGRTMAPSTVPPITTASNNEPRPETLGTQAS